jgi:hypothetical protein
MQFAAAALWETREGAISLSRAGYFDYLRRFVQTLATTGWLGMDPLDNQTVNHYTDKDVYRGLVDLEIKLANQWTSPSSIDPSKIVTDRSVNKVTASFARAGIFMIHPNCLDGDTSNNAPCIDGDSGGDAVIDITDNDPEDDPQNAYGVFHEEGDWLRPGSPAPSFHVWTGPRYIFSGSDALFGTGTVPLPLCNNMFNIEVAEDEAFTEILKTSGWLLTSSSKPCYSNWSLTDFEWQDITDKLAADGKDRIYYRVITCTVEPGSGTPCFQHGIHPVLLGGHIRDSTAPANGLFGQVQPPYAFVNKWGTYPPFHALPGIVLTDAFARFDLPFPPLDPPQRPQRTRSFVVP